MSRTQVVRDYFKAIEAGDLQAMLNCYDPKATQIELPNLLKAKGDKRSVPDLKRDFARGAKLLKRQSYEIVSILEQNNRVAAEVIWRGTLAIPVKALREGDEMKAYSAIFFEFENGLIASQKNYDCFEAF